MHPEVPEEQAYFDRALDLRERLEANLDRAAALASDAKTSADLRRRVGALGVVDPSQAVAFGRIDLDGQRWYIGRGAIWDERNDLLVVNWQAPIAAPFYTATPDQPGGLDSRRIFRCKENRILDIEEMVFNGVAAAVTNGEAPGLVVTDALLESLGRQRSGALADIVATIQAAQYDVVAREAEQLLIVQGGPGTGKTVVGLHRVSWLLFNRRDQLRPNDVLIVGPNPGFLRYISAVLPGLGEGAVVQLPLVSLGPRVRAERIDTPDLRRLKGDRRMLRLLVRAIRNRQRIRRGPVELVVEGRRVTIDGEQLLARARQVAGHPHNEARRALRAFMVEEILLQLRERALRDPEAPKIVLEGDTARDIDNYLDRVWPNLTPEGFLVEVFSTRQQLVAAAAGLLTAGETDLLTLPRDAEVGTWDWSVDDVPLLDLSDALLNGAPVAYEYIVVDEAQDLSPMQFESIRRRSRTGWMTVLGDLAQATSPWAPASWEEVALHLRRDRVPTEIAELSLGYRLPSEVHDIAMRLLPEIAPGLRCPDPVRSSGSPITTLAAYPEELGDEVVRAVRALPSTGLVGVITSNRDRSAITKALDAEGLSWRPELDTAAAPITVLGSEETKGLEFDNVVVVEPARIAAESPQGLRALFVALTRPTSRLVLVHAEPLPEVLGLDSPLPYDDRDDAEYEYGEPDRYAEAEVEVAADDGGYGDYEYVDDDSDEDDTQENELTPVFEAPAPMAPASPPPAPRRPSNGNIDLRQDSIRPESADPFAALDDEMARAVANKLAEALTRYATPALIPKVLQQMARILQVDHDH